MAGQERAHHLHHRAAGGARIRPLAIALGITVIFLLIEIVGGILTNSLALLADAGHMATDVAALALALFAVWLARRPATPRRSFGYYRAEVLAALFNAATLVAISFYIFWESFKRLAAPPEVESLPMLLVALAGLAANLLSAWILARGGGHEHDLNRRGAFLHVVNDLLGSAATVLAALIILATGWYLVDPLLSAGIGFLILRGSWQLLAESVNVLLDATPAHLDSQELREAMEAVEGVHALHDLHIRTVTSGLITLSAHLELSGDRDWHAILQEEATLLRERFGIAHVTLQPEQPALLSEALLDCSLDTPEGIRACQRALRALDGAHSDHQH